MAGRIPLTVNTSSLSLEELPSGIDLDVTGSNLITSSTTVGIFDTTATTINFGGEATVVSIGASSGTTTIQNNLSVVGNLSITGEIAYDDRILTIGGATQSGADDNKDRGIAFNWATGGNAKTGFFGFDDSNGKFTFIPDATNTSNVISGTAGGIVVSDITATTALFSDTTDSTLSSNGAVVIAGGLGVAKNIVCDGTFSIFGDISVNGGDILTNQTSVTLFNTTATTVNAFGAGTSIIFGANGSGTTTIRNATTAVSGALTVGGTASISGVTTFSNTTDSTLSSNGSVIFAGGIGVAKNIVCDGTFSIFGDISVNGGDILTNQTSVSLFNTTATTATLLGDATTISLGASSGTTTVNNNLVVTGNLTVNGTTTTINSTTLTVDDKNIVLASGAADSSSADGSGISVDGASATITYVHSGTKWALNKNVDITGTLTASSNGSIGGTLAVTGATTLTGALAANGGITVDSTNFTVDGSTGAVSTASTLSVAGASTLTGKTTVKASVDHNSGSTTVANQTAIQTIVASTSQQVADSFAVATYRSAKYMVQITQGTNYQVSEIMVIHNGTSATMTEYGMMNTNGVLGTFVCDVSAGNARLLVTMGSATSATINITRTTIVV